MTVIPTGLADGFARHGVDHLSASSLNLWAAEPALWTMERLLGYRAPVSAAAVRGRAVEAGVDHGLLRPDLPADACAALALGTYDREMTLETDPRREDERRQIPGYVEHGLAELRHYGVPSAAQEPVEVRLEGVPVPIQGYIDWRFDQHGLIVDLKTAERLPAAISSSHGRQGAVYAAAHGNYAMRFAYAKPVAGKRDGRAVAVYEMTADEVRRHLAALTQVAIRLGRFLALSGDAHELAGLLVPDYDAFWWSNPIPRAHGARVYGF